MKKFLMLLLAGLALLTTGPVRAQTVVQASGVSLRTADGVTVYGLAYESAGPARAVILMFHQAGSSAAEYAEIAPLLTREHYAGLAIDQRVGDEMYGPNQTAIHFRKKAEYVDALPDLEAALAWAHKTYPGKAVILWGSSYSASLVFLVAAKHPAEVAALLAFSPGEYLNDKSAVKRAAAKVSVPIFVDSGADGEEIEAARSILAASPSKHKVQYVPKHGVHGSSTLREDRDPKGYDENWKAVFAFLNSLSIK